MSDATRKVTIILDVKAGEMPDMSWVTSAKNEMAVLTKESNSVAEQTKAIKEESQDLLKTQTEAIKAETELLKLKDESAKKTGEQKVQQETYWEWHARTQAEYRAREEQQAKEHAERLKQVEQQKTVEQQRPAFVPPTPNPRLPLREPGDGLGDRASYRDRQIQQQIERQQRAEEVARQQRQREHEQELAEIDRMNAEQLQRQQQEEQEAQQQREERAQRIVRRIWASELQHIRQRQAEEDQANERRMQQAQQTLQRIRQTELQNVRERREQAEEDAQRMPTYWRNVGLNAGQAVASAARYISHMRMLKNVGGETLESMAKQFMTIQSRIETIAASTSFFTNTGTMLSGLQTAGQAMERVIQQQQIMRQEATLVQTATIGIGRAATSVLPFVAPLQLAFSLVTAGIVGADIAMDFFGESSEAALEKSRQNAQKFEEQLAKSIGKLEMERQLIASQNDLLELQWQMKQRIVGEENINTSDVMKHQEQQRATREAEVEAEHKKKATEIFEGGLSEEEKARRGKLAEERAKLEAENKNLETMITTIREKGMHIGNREKMEELASAQITVADNNFRLDQIYNEQDLLDASTYSGTGVDTIDIQNGQIQNFDEHMADLNKIKDEDKRKKAQALYAESLQQSNSLLVEQQADAERRAKEEKAKAEQAPREAERIKREQEAERAMAINYSMEDSQWRANEARQEMQVFRDAQTPEDRADAAKRAQQLLQGQGGNEPNLMTPQLQEQLSLGAAADPAKVNALIDDASVYDQGEQTDYDQAIEAAMKAKQDAEAQSAAMQRLAESLQDILKESKRQIDTLQRAIENRDQ